MKYTPILAVILALLLCALPANAEVYCAPGLFTLRYDEQCYTLDDVAYSYENTGGNAHWFFILYNDEVMINASMENLQDCAVQSLVGESLSQPYIADMQDLYSDQDAAFLTAIDTSGGKVPFYVFSCKNEDGPYLMAETVIDGKAFDFMIYYNDSTLPTDDRLAQTLTAVLEGININLQ